MASIFTKIINGDIPSYKIAEEDNYYAFLDINPLAKGHTLVIPKIETDYIFDLPDDVLSGLHVFSKKVANALEQTIECKRVGVLVIGTEVPHAHIHLIPFQSEVQMAITSKKISLSAQEMEEIASKASSQYKRMNSNTLVFGASLKEERYSNKAIHILLDHDYGVNAVGGREGNVRGVKIEIGHPTYEHNIDTITMYMGADRQKDHYDYLLGLKPRRIIFNPGAENQELASLAKDKGIIAEEACTLVLLRTKQY